MKQLPWIISGICVVWAIIATTCSGPEPVSIDPERELQYRRQHVIDSIKLVESGARINAIQKTLVDTVKAVIVKAEAKDKENKLLRTRLAKTRAEVQPMLDTSKTLKLFVYQQDSLINFQEGQIADLQGGMYRVAKELSNLIGEQAVNSRVAAEMLQNCERSREELKKENEQLRKPKLTLKGFLKKLRNYTIAGAIGAAAVKVADELKD